MNNLQINGINKIIFVLCIIFIGCEEKEIHNIIKKSTSKIGNLSVYKSDYNGYSEKDVCKGQLFGHDSFYKIVFVTDKHGLIATKNAFSTNINKKLLYILFAKSSIKLVHEMKLYLGDEFENYWEKTDKASIGAVVIHIKSKGKMIFMAKNVYDSYIEDHPNVHIMDI